MLEAHLLQIHLEFFRDQHRDRRVGALAHLDIGHGQDDLAVAVDADEGIRREALGVSCFASTERQAQHQPAADRDARNEEAAPRQVDVRSAGRGAGNHGQPPFSFVSAASLIASRMRT